MRPYLRFLEVARAGSGDEFHRVFASAPGSRANNLDGDDLPDVQSALPPDFDRINLSQYFACG
jgi:hypothetical protein